MDQKQTFIHTNEAARMLGVTTRRIVGLCREGKLMGAVQEGRNWKIPFESVQQMARSGKDDTQAGAENRLPCAVGNTSYTEMASECYYVDKTLLIRDLIDDHNMVTLFARPRRFGKTLALNMLKTFFEKTDEDTAKYFANRKIWQCGEKYRQMQAAFPVIMLTFKDVKLDGWAESQEAILFVIEDEYKRHPELLGSTKLDEDDKNYIRRLYQGALSNVELGRSLLNLTRMLSKHHGARTVILIDEYDTPIQQGYAKGFYREAIAFMRNFLSGGLKDNPDLAFGVLTGIMRISKENLFSGLNNLIVNTVLDEKYSEYFGFTYEEVLQMADYYGFAGKMDEIRSWYDGYHFGQTDIYNPWSVSNYFAGNAQAKAFWANTSDNEIIREIMQDLTPEIADELLKVMQGEEIHASLNMEVVYPKISEGPDAVFSFLLLAGYLTLKDRPEETEFGTFATLRLPNMEIRRVYNTEILSWLRTKITSGTVSEVEKAIYLSDAARLQKALREYMLSTISCYDGAAEGFYHGMVLGLVASLSSRYYIRSNREAGEGRFDLQLEPKEKDLPGVIMEFKAARTDEQEQLSALAENALAQIEARDYEKELSERGVESVVKYGIAFAGKNVEIRIREH